MATYDALRYDHMWPERQQAFFLFTVKHSIIEQRRQKAQYLLIDSLKHEESARVCYKGNHLRRKAGVIRSHEHPIQRPN